jgi:hypothetical protein
MPSTAEGKEIVSANGLAHGLAGRKFALIPGESQDEFDARQLAGAEWKLNRADNLETGCFSQAMEAENCPPPAYPGKPQAKRKKRSNRRVQAFGSVSTRL